MGAGDAVEGPADLQEDDFSSSGEEGDVQVPAKLPVGGFANFELVGAADDKLAAEPADPSPARLGKDVGNAVDEPADGKLAATLADTSPAGQGEHAGVGAQEGVSQVSGEGAGEGAGVPDMEPTDVGITDEELAAVLADKIGEFCLRGHDPSYWLRLCPWLHVNDEGMRETAHRSIFPYGEGDADLADRADALSDDLVREGFFTVPADELPWEVDVAAVAKGIETLQEAGLPPTCIMAYDEPWVLAAQLSQLVRLSTGGNEPIMDFSAFCVRAGGPTDGREPGCDRVGDAVGLGGAAPAGWPPHRDRCSDDAAVDGFRADGSPRYATFWIALTDATPESSCLMVVPRAHDPGYSKGDCGVSPLTAIFKTPSAFQNIRALPAPAGSLISFSHRLLHWGSKADPRAAAPRVALAFAAADPTFAPAYFSRSLLPLPPLSVRRALIAGQSLVYGDNEAVVTSRARAGGLLETFRASAGQFDASFQRSVHLSWADLDRKLRGPEDQDEADAPLPVVAQEEAAGELGDLFGEL